jgi:hypothetical protein
MAFSLGYGSLFETRLHTISRDDALDKRKIWEGFVQWANKLSRIDSDAIARGQFTTGDFRPDAFCEMDSVGFTHGSFSGIIQGSYGAVGISKKFESLDISGDYWMDWSVSLKRTKGQARWVSGIPFIGNHFFGSAQDFRAQMGFYQNGQISVTTKFSGSDTASDPSGSADSNDGSVSTDEWRYGHYGRRVSVSKDTHSYTESREYVPREGADDGQNDYYHLSGSGCASVGRVTGNIGVLILGQDGSEFELESGHISLRRRVR